MLSTAAGGGTDSEEKARAQVGSAVDVFVSYLCTYSYVQKKETHALFMVALCNRADHYIFILFLLLSSSSFFSLPNLSSRRLDVYHTSAHGVVLV